MDVMNREHLSEVQADRHDVANAMAYEEEIDLREYLQVLIRERWLIAACAIGIGGLALLYALFASPVYQADALLQVEEKKSGLGDLTDLSALLEGSASTEAEIEIIRSRSVLGKVIDSLGLDVIVKPVAFPLIGGFLSRHYQGDGPSEPWLGMESFAWGGEELKLDRLDVSEELLGVEMTLTVEEGGRFHLVDENGSRLLDAEVGKAASDHGVSIFVSFIKARPGTRFTILSLPRQEVLQALQEHLQVSEKGKQTGILSIAYESNDPDQAMRVVNAVAQAYLRQNVERKSEEASRALAFLEHQLPEVRSRMDAAEASLNAYRLQQGSVDLGIETQAILNQMVEIEGKLSELNLKRAELGQKFKPQHPMMQALEQQAARLRLEKAKLEKKIGTLPETEQKILMLTRDVKVNTELYTSLLDKAQELKVVKAGTIGNVRIIDHAIRPNKPIKPRKGLIILAGIALGVFFGVLLAFIRKALHQGVEDPEIIEQQLGVPVYASIPYSRTQEALHKAMREGRGEGASLLAKEDGNDLAVESLRSLRTNIHFALMDATNKVIALSGPAPGLGKSFISANLAYVLADAGQRVLVIDGDLRKGHLHEYYGLPRSPGLSGFLAGRVELDQAVHDVGLHENLCIMPTGVLPPNPAELLMSERFDEMLATLAQRFDVILIDTPPVLAATDAVVIARRSAATFLLLRAGMHPLAEIKQAVRHLERADIKVTGAIFNGMEHQKGYGYGGYHYQYEYSPASGGA